MNIGKAAPPQTLPISASIPLARLPFDRQELLSCFETLEVFDLLKNAVGVSMDTLYLTAHLGSEEVRTELTKYGFHIERQHICVYVLSKNHDTTTITAASLCDELTDMRASGQAVLVKHDAESNMASIPGIMDDKLARHLMRLIVPAHTLSLAVVFPMIPAIGKLSFDTLFLGSYARGRHQHQQPLNVYLQNELGYLNEVVAAKFPDLAPAFKVWAGGYIHYLLDRIAQPGVAEEVVTQVTTAMAQAQPDSASKPSPEADDPSASGAPEAPPVKDESAPPVETLKEKLGRLLQEEGIVPEGGPLSETFDVEQTTSHEGVVNVRRSVPLALRAWRIPSLSMRSEMINIPYWAMKHPKWDFTTCAGKWLVFDGDDVEIMANEQFIDTFEITE